VRADLTNILCTYSVSMQGQTNYQALLGSCKNGIVRLAHKIMDKQCESKFFLFQVDVYVVFPRKLTNIGALFNIRTCGMACKSALL